MGDDAICAAHLASGALVRLPQPEMPSRDSYYLLVPDSYLDLSNAIAIGSSKSLGRIADHADNSARRRFSRRHRLIDHSVPVAT
jgi:hypothetical protein